jgi:hypothetical protein
MFQVPRPVDEAGDPVGRKVSVLKQTRLYLCLEEDDAPMQTGEEMLN